MIDFSIAQRPGRVESGTGTRRWMAPEQEHGGLVSEKTDVWGIGAVLRWAGLDFDVADDPAERPTVDDVARWLEVKALVRSCAPR